MSTDDYLFTEVSCDASCPKAVPAAFDSASLIRLVDNEESGSVAEKGYAVSSTEVVEHSSHEGRRGPCISLRVLHFNDLHYNLLEGGERMLAGIKSARQEAEEDGKRVLTLSAGDDHVGSLFDALLEFPSPGEKRSFAYHIYSELPVDLAVIGNHELDFGYETLAHIMSSDATFPVCTANIRHPLFPGYAGMIGRIEGWRIGIAAVTTLDELHVRGDTQRGIYLESPMSYAPPLIDYMNARVDLLIVLSHLGLFERGSDQNDRALARLLKKSCRVPSLIIGAHSHTRIDPIPQIYREDGIPLFQTGAFARAYGIIDIELGERGTDAAEGGELCRDGMPLCRVKAQLQPTPPAEQGGGASSRIGELIRAELHRIDELVEGTGGVVKGGLSPETRTRALCDKFGLESPTANAITDAMAGAADRLLADLAAEGYPVLAACDSTGFREWRPEGVEELRVKEWYEIIPYADTVCVGVLSEEELRSLLRENAARFLPPYLFSERGGFLEMDDWDNVMRGRLHFSAALRYRLVLDGKNEKGAEMELPDGREELMNYRLPARPEKISFDRGTATESGKVLLLLSSNIAMGGQGWESWPLFSPDGGRFTDTGVTLRRAMLEAAAKGHEFSFETDGRVRSPWDYLLQD